jgi:ribosomal protein S6--L-glutamate ligase
MDVILGGEPGQSFDAIISRAKLGGDDWRGRVERLSMVSSIPGVRMFDPVQVWTNTSSKFLTTQRLAQAGLPVPATCSVSTLDEVRAAAEKWDDIIIKPSYGYRSKGLARVRDFDAQTAEIEPLLATYGTMLCMPFYPTQYGEYRVHVAGETVPIAIMKLPAAGDWRNRGEFGSSFERIDPPAELRELALRAARAMGLTLTSLDIMPTDDGYVILELNSIPGFLGYYGEQPHMATMNGVYDWVEKRLAED